MHALTCEIFEAGDACFAAIPTYQNPGKYLLARVHIEYVYHDEQSIFYHCSIAELIGDDASLASLLSSASLRCLRRGEAKPRLCKPPIAQFSLDKPSMLNDLQAWCKDYVIDLPAPFATKSKAGLIAKLQEIEAFYASMLHNVSTSLATIQNYNDEN